MKWQIWYDRVKFYAKHTLSNIWHTVILQCNLKPFSVRCSVVFYALFKQWHLTKWSVRKKKKEKKEERWGKEILEDQWNLLDDAQLMLDVTTARDRPNVRGENLRGMVTLKCWGSASNSFLLSSFKPTPVGPAQTKTSKLTQHDNDRSHRIYQEASAIR